MEWEGKLQAGRQVVAPAVVEELELPVVRVPAVLEEPLALEEQPALEAQVGMN